MDIATAAPVAQDENTALADLKTKINDRTCPTLDLARALQTHLDTYPQSTRTLTEKLGMPEKRPYFIKVLALLKLPEDVQKGLEGKRLGYREIESLVTQSANQPANHQEPPQTSANQPANQQQPPRTTETPAANQQEPPRTSANQPANHPSQGYPLIRDTIDELVKLLTFWRQQLNMGQVVERWLIYFGQIGWLRATFRVLYLALAIYGTLQISAAITRRQPWIPVWRIHKGGVGGAVMANGTSPTPQFTESRLIAGNQMLLRWAPVPGAATYRVYWNGQDGRVEAVDQDVTATGVTVNRQSATGNEKGFLSVTAIGANQAESSPSPGVEYDLAPVNIGRLSGVKPLPQVAVAPSSAAPVSHPANSKPVTAIAKPVLNPPVEVHATVRTPDLIRLSWRAVGPDVRYNVYSSATSVLSSLRKENDHPLKSNTVDWTPETGLETYWIVVTTLDGQGHESAYSEAIQVVRHPEKSGSNAALDAATGEVRKLLPW